jgi:hypothetical protein
MVVTDGHSCTHEKTGAWGVYVVALSCPVLSDRGIKRENSAGALLTATNSPSSMASFGL